jgi:GalNAc5-diNAcBac-PP-undecaprenol beta-1,3-glucosyltransferase
MPRATVVIPTHTHFATLPYAVRSVQNQGVDDIEIFIIGDGVDDTMRATVRALQAGDPRIRFFDMPKGPRRGELNRDQALHEAQGRIICYSCDDDLWLPNHLQAMEEALEDADFVGAMHLDVSPEDRIRGYFFDLDAPEFVEPWFTWQFNRLGGWANDGFGLSNGAHRRDAYFRLPERWSTTPDGLPTDNFMWHKFKRAEWCRSKFLRFPVTLHFELSERRDWTQQQCAEELERWSAIIAGPDGMTRIMRGLLADLGDRLLAQGIDGTRQRADIVAQQSAEIIAERERQLRESRAECRQWAEIVAECERKLRESRDECRQWAEIVAERERKLRESRDECRQWAEIVVQRDRRFDDVLASTSWRLTAPMRAASHAIRRLWGHKR